MENTRRWITYTSSRLEVFLLFNLPQLVSLQKVNRKKVNVLISHLSNHLTIKAFKIPLSLAYYAFSLSFVNDAKNCGINLPVFQDNVQW